MTDYLAIIPIGGGSSWGRSPDKEKAIAGAIKSLRDWESLFAVANVEVTLNVMDVEGHDHVTWGTDGFYADGKKFTPTVERIKRTTPKWKTGK